jgi:hypothetical protein
MVNLGVDHVHSDERKASCCMAMFLSKSDAFPNSSMSLLFRRSRSLPMSGLKR